MQHDWHQVLVPSAQLSSHARFIQELWEAALLQKCYTKRPNKDPRGFCKHTYREAPIWQVCWQILSTIVSNGSLVTENRCIVGFNSFNLFQDLLQYASVGEVVLKQNANCWEWPQQESYCQWGDDQTCWSSQVLVSVHVVGVGHAHTAVVNVQIPVVAQVLHPFKVTHTSDLQ